MATSQKCSHTFQSESSSSPREAVHDNTYNTAQANDNRVATTRHRITHMIRNRLKYGCDTRMIGDDDKINKMSECLERLLFQSEPCFKRYSDISTLKTRMRYVICTRLQKRMNASVKRNRRKHLLDTIGKERYEIADALVQNIKIEQCKKVASMKCFGGLCSTPFKRDSNFPQPIRDLFFETPLLDAFERSPIDTITTMDWDVLIEDAREKLSNYRRWVGYEI